MKTRLSTFASIALLTAACGGPSMSATASSDPRIRSADPRQGDATAATPAASMSATPASSNAPPPAPSASSSSSARVADADVPKRIGARHVLVQWMGSERAAPSVVRTKDQALVVAKEVLKRAKAGEDLGRLAAEYSDEPGAAGRGGSLGRFSHGQMVPAFEEAAFHLKVGEISDLVETPFGYHVIQRTE